MPLHQDLMLLCLTVPFRYLKGTVRLKSDLTKPYCKNYKLFSMAENQWSKSFFFQFYRLDLNHFLQLYFWSLQLVFLKQETIFALRNSLGLQIMFLRLVLRFLAKGGGLDRRLLYLIEKPKMIKWSIFKLEVWFFVCRVNFGQDKKSVTSVFLFSS